MALSHISMHWKGKKNRWFYLYPLLHRSAHQSLTILTVSQTILTIVPPLLIVNSNRNSHITINRLSAIIPTAVSKNQDTANLQDTQFRNNHGIFVLSQTCSCLVLLHSLAVILNCSTFTKSSGLKNIHFTAFMGSCFLPFCYSRYLLSKV